MSTVAVNSKLYFAGGLESFNDDALDRVDIYDDASNSWSTSHLSEPKIGFAAIAVADKIYWAGGVNACSVEIKDINTGASANAYLYRVGDNVGDKAVTKDGKIVFRPRYYYDDKFDIYDIATATWSIGVLPVGIYHSSIICVNNTIYIAGGDLNGPLSNQVWKLEF
jgi:N-acetylneuraminic acid mutarotase